MTDKPLRINLVPAPRRLQAARRARRRAWIALGIGYVVVLAVAYIVIAAAWSSDGSRAAAELRRANESIASTNQNAQQVRSQLAEVRQNLDAIHTVSDQPDWSGLLAIIAATLGDDTVLDGVHLAPAGAIDSTTARPVLQPGQPANPAPAQTSAAPGAGFVLHLSGVGRTQAAVSQLALRLEATGLFDRVEVLRTNREGFLDGSGIAFSIECAIGKTSSAPAPAITPSLQANTGSEP